MFRDLEAKTAITTRSYAIPDGTRVYAIGDIHGRLDLLENIYKQIEIDIEKYPVHIPVIVHLGDYVDRGENSKGVIDFLLGDLKYERVFIRGNHDQGLLKVLNDPSILPHKLKNGFDAVLYNYGVEDIYRKDLEEVINDFKEVFPLEHSEFFKNTVLTKTIGDYLFVHAGINPDNPIDQQSERDLVIIRAGFLDSIEEFPYKVVFGHSVFESVTDLGNKIAVDTGAYATGKLSCAVLEGQDLRSLFTG